MDDDAFVRAFLAGSLPPTQFHHRDHLRLTWVLVRRYGASEASATIASGIQHYAAAHGHSGLYHETLTLFWVGLVAHTIAAQPQIDDFAAFLAAFPFVLDKGLPWRHWHQDTLRDAASRTSWVEPDLLALPW